MTTPQTHHDEAEPDEEPSYERQQELDEMESEAVERGNEDERNRGDT